LIPPIRWRVTKVEHLVTDKPGEVLIEVTCIATGHDINLDWALDNPIATLRMTIKHPVLKSQLEVGNYYDAEFTEVRPEELEEE
jgi:hypothetical protein